MRIWLGIQYFIYTDDPIMTEAILNHPHCLDKGRSYRFLSMSLGDGLVTLNGSCSTVVSVRKKCIILYS